MAALDLVPLLAAFLLALVCYMLLVSYRMTLGALLTLLANALNVSILTKRPFAFLAGALDALNSFMNNSLASGVRAGEHAFSAVVNFHAILWHDLTAAVADLADAAERQFRHLSRHSIAAIVHAITDPYGTALQFVKGQVAQLVHDVSKASKAVTRVVVHDLPSVVVNFPKRITIETRKAIAAIPAINAPAIPRLGSIEHDLASVEKWIRTHGKQLTEAGIVGLVVAALSRIGLNWTRCSNTSKYGKNLCGMDPSLVESLIADTLLVLGTVSLLEFAQGMQGLTEESAKTIGGFWRA